jgi:hypothetical protein
MMDTRYDSKGDPKLSPAGNAKAYLDRFQRDDTMYIRDHDGDYLKMQPLAREAFMGPDGRLDAKKIYREGIAVGKKMENGEDKTIPSEFRELLRYVLLLDPTKEETHDMAVEFLGRHVPESTPISRKRSQNGQQWYRQLNDIFMFGSDG